MRTIMDYYYGINNVWLWSNLFLIPPFIYACYKRFRNQSFSVSLWTDHLSRFGLAFTLLIYIFDSTIKYIADGDQSICQKTLLIHHIASFFIILPIIMNSYIPWWVNPIGFLHGIIVFFPDLPHFQQIYGFAILYFHFRLYRLNINPEGNLKGYSITRFAINFVWAFIIIYRIGDCSNYLPL